ncbi:MAG: STAS domain-containing protein [Ignavibacteria bacterium]|nr:STAS domain-containing protein [Ignavibacteria bacterium]
MKFSTEQRGTVTVIGLEGSLMGGPESSALNGQINEMVDQGKIRVVIDLARVGFMNSSGLGLLINSATTLKNAGGSLKLANASEKITALLKITKLAPLFETHSSVQTAVDSFTN